MKKHEIPDKDEWEKIVDEAFSSNENHKFSENYKMKKNSILKGAIIMKKHNILMNLTVTAAALAVVAFPTGIYFATRTAETTPATQLSSENETDKIYDFEYGWLPEGFASHDDKRGIYRVGHKICIGAKFIKNLSGEETEKDSEFTLRDEYQTDDKTVEIRYNDDYVEDSEDIDCMNYGRRVTIYFKDTPYELTLSVSDDFKQDDLKKIIENIRLVPSDTETASIYEVMKTEITITNGNDDVQTVTETEMTITDGNDDGQINEQIHQFTEDDIDYDTIYNVEYGWLPEGLEYQGEDSPYGGKFHNWTTNDGMTPAFSKVQKGAKYYEDTGNPEIETTKDEWLLDGKTVSMYYRSTYNPDNPVLNFGRIAFIYFDNTPYVLKLYVTDGISEEDFRKIIDNVKLVPSEEETANIYTSEALDMLQEYRSGNTENTDNTEQIDVEVGSYANEGILVKESTIVQIGEEVHEKSPDIFGDISAKITGVRFDDDFNGLTTDQIGNPADFSKYLNTDGKLIENVNEFYDTKEGYKIIHFDNSPVSVMTVTVTYTNNGTKPTDFGGYCIFPTLQTQYDGYFFTPYIYNVMEVETMLEETMVGYADNYDHMSFGGQFSFSSPNQEGKNEIHLDAGESAEVTMAFIVEDKFRDNLYLSMNNNGFVDLSNLE